MYPSRTTCIFWTAWCATFLVFNVVFMFLDAGWWSLYFGFWAITQLLCLRFWVGQLWKT